MNNSRKYVDLLLKLLNPDNFHENFEKERSEIEDAIPLMTKYQLVTFWDTLLSWLHKVLEGVTAQPLSERDKNLLDTIIDAAILFSSGVDDDNIPDGLKQVVHLINLELTDGILVAMSSGSKQCLLVYKTVTKKDGLKKGWASYFSKEKEFQQLQVSFLSEKWILKQFESYRQLVPNAVVTLVKFARKPRAQTSLFSRLWALRHSVTDLDLFAEENVYVKECLLTCCEASRFLQVAEGKKFLIYLMCRNASFGVLMHELFKARIPYLTEDEAETVGEIYFKAWKHAEEEGKTLLEEKCLQFLMDHAMVALRSKVEGGHCVMADVCFHILHGIHKCVSTNNEQKMLRLLYAPILWRSLKAPNHLVRVNATRIFCDVFPICGDSDEETVELANKQYSALVGLLKDDVPAVRRAAIKGSCSVLKKMWQAIPAQFMNSIVSQLAVLAFDASSYEVRAEVIRGIPLILDNPLTHEFFKKFLSDIRTVLHDINQNVRSAFIDLLLSVTSLRTLKWWHISDIPNVLGRLAAESSEKLCRKLVKLLIPTLFPEGKTDEELMNRVITFVNMNSEAVLKIFHHSNKMIELDRVLHVATLMVRCLRTYIKKEKKKLEQSDASTVGQKPDEANETAQEESLMTHQNATVFLDIVALTLFLNVGSLYTAKYTDQLIELRKHFGASAGLFLTYFKESTSDVRSLIFIYSMLGSSNRWTNMYGFTFKSIRELSDSVPEEEFGFLVDALCNWKRGDEVLDLVSEWISSVYTQNLEKTIVEPVKSRKKKKTNGDDSENEEPAKKTVRFDKPENPKPLLGTRIVTHLLRNKSDKKVMLDKFLTQMSEFCEKLRKVTKLVEQKIAGKSMSPLATSAFVREACVLLMKLTPVLEMHEMELEREKEGEEEEENQENVKPEMAKTVQLVNWLDRTVLARMTDQEETVTEFTATTTEARASTSRFSSSKRLNSIGTKRKASDSDSPDFVFAETLLVDCLAVGAGLLLCRTNKEYVDAYLSIVKNVLSLDNVGADFIEIGLNTINAILPVDTEKKWYGELAVIFSLCLGRMVNIVVVHQDNPVNLFSTLKDVLLNLISTMTQNLEKTFLIEMSTLYIVCMIDVAFYFTEARLAEATDSVEDDDILPKCLQFKKVSDLHPFLSVLCQVLQLRSSFAEIILNRLQEDPDFLDRSHIQSVLTILHALEKDKGRIPADAIKACKLSLEEKQKMHLEAQKEEGQRREIAAEIEKSDTP